MTSNHSWETGPSFRDLELPFQQTRSKSHPPLFCWLAFAGAVSVLIGSFGPWAYVWSPYGTYNVGGLVQNGMFTAVLSLLAIVLILSSLIYRGSVWARTASAGAFFTIGVTAWVGCSNSFDMTRWAYSGEQDLILNPGWGLALVALGGLIGTVGSLLHYLTGN